MEEENVNKKYDDFVAGTFEEYKDNFVEYFAAIGSELTYACGKYPPHPSLEHSMYTLKEEVRELDDELQMQYDRRSEKHIKNEAIQVAAMAVRLMLDYDFWKSQGKVYGTVHQ